MDSCTWWIRWCYFIFLFLVNLGLWIYALEGFCKHIRTVFVVFKLSVYWFTFRDRKRALFYSVIFDATFLFQFVNNTWSNPLFDKSMSCYFADHFIQPSRSLSSAASSSLGVKYKFLVIACYMRSKCLLKIHMLTIFSLLLFIFWSKKF